MKSLLILPVILVIIVACKHDDEKYIDLKDSWQEKAKKARANQIPEKIKSLKREKITISSGAEAKNITRLPKTSISIRYHKQDLGSVLRSLGKLAGINIIVDDSLKQLVTLELNDVPWNIAFSGVMNSNALEYTYESNILYIITPQSIRSKLETENIKEQLNQARQRVKKSSPLLIRTVKIDHLDVEKTSELMKKLLSGKSDIKSQQNRSSVEVDKETNNIIINATAEDINKMLTLVEKLDRPAVQVLIEAQIVITNQRTARELGMMWGGGFKVENHMDATSLSNFPVTFSSTDSETSTTDVVPTGLTLGGLYTDSNMTIEAQLTALEENGDAHIVSSPTITTLNNVLAFIESGTEIPYQSTSDSQGTTTEFKKAVLRLEVTPHVIDNELIKLNVITNNDEPDNTITNKDLEPAITTRKAKTTVLLRNGQTTVIAGLTKVYTSEAASGVPFLKDIPYLGQLFRYNYDEKEMSDLLIFITPYIITPSKVPPSVVKVKKEQLIEVIGEQDNE